MRIHGVRLNLKEKQKRGGEMHQILMMTDYKHLIITEKTVKREWIHIRQKLQRDIEVYFG